MQNLIVIMIWEGGGFAGGREEADEQMSMTISEKCVTTDQKWIGFFCCVVQNGLAICQASKCYTHMADVDCIDGYG